MEQLLSISIHLFMSRQSYTIENDNDIFIDHKLEKLMISMKDSKNKRSYSS